MRSLRLTLLALAAASCLAWPLCSWAAEDSKGTFSFTWDAPASCPSRSQVEAELTLLLGRPVQLQRGDDLDVHASVTRGQAWSVALETRRAGRAGGRRFIEAPSCQALAEATALIVALTIDPDAVAAHTQERGEQAAQPAPSVTDAPAIPPPSTSTGFVAGVHIQTRLGTLPGVDVGLGGGVGIVGRRWTVGLRGAYGVRGAQSAHLPAYPDAGGRFRILTGALVGCFDLLATTGIALGPCAVAEAGVVSATGYGADAGFAKRAPWLAVGSGGYITVPWGRHLEASLHLDVLVPLWRPAYVFAGAPGAVFQSPAVGALALASIGWRF